MQSRLSLFIKALPLFIACLAASSGSNAQRVPASSSDSGRRAIIAINQAEINNNINNTANTANNAISIANYSVSRGDNALHQAERAYEEARRAATISSNYYNGRIIGEFHWTNCNGYTSNCYIASGLCITGWQTPEWWPIPRNLCPENAGYYGSYYPKPEQTPPSHYDQHVSFI